MRIEPRRMEQAGILTETFQNKKFSVSIEASFSERMFVGKLPHAGI